MKGEYLGWSRSFRVMLATPRINRYTGCLIVDLNTGFASTMSSVRLRSGPPYKFSINPAISQGIAGFFVLNPLKSKCTEVAQSVWARVCLSCTFVHVPGLITGAQEMRRHNILTARRPIVNPPP